MKPQLGLILCSVVLFACSNGAINNEVRISATQTDVAPSTTPQPTSTATVKPSSTSTATDTPTLTLTPSETPTPTQDLSFFDIFACLPKGTVLQEGIVTEVIDGDTVTIRYEDGITNTIRYIGIDAPESGMPFSTEATKANSQLVLNKKVNLIRDSSETDQYDRLLRYVVADNKLVNLELVKMGVAMAESWPPDVACDEAFTNAEQEAQSTQIGMWVATATPSASDAQVIIISVNKREEYVDLQNIGTEDVDLTGWNLVSERGQQGCPLSGIIEAGEVLRIWSMAAQGDGFSCGYSSPIWNNSELDPAVLYNAGGMEVGRK